jgi:putative SOS response-associated peptidase YedK
MCGRFTLHHTTKEVAERFNVQQVLFEPEPRYNVAPSQNVAVITQGAYAELDNSRLLEGYKWGLIPSWAKDPAIGYRMINARAETLVEKPSFRSALRRRRCLVPADGFYEWPKEEKAAKSEPRQPLHIRTNNGELFAFAGLWDEWQSPDGSPIRTCTIITTEPNELLSTVHHRMAVMLPREFEEAWLDNTLDDVPELLNILKPYPADTMEMYPVSPSVNAPAFDAPDCIAPFGHTQDQLSLL